MCWTVGNVRPPIYEFGGQEFESLRARHFGTKLGTPKPAVGLTASPRGVWARGRCGNWIIFLAGSGQWGPIAIQPKGDSKCHRCVCG